MAVNNAQVSVSTTATALNAADGTQREQSIAVQNVGAADVYLGDEDVTTANGFKLAVGATMTFDLEADEILYGRVASGTNTVHVLRVGV